MNPYAYALVVPPWLFNIAMENCPFTDDIPFEPSIHKGFSMAMLVSGLQDPIEAMQPCQDETIGRGEWRGWNPKDLWDNKLIYPLVN